MKEALQNIRAKRGRADCPGGRRRRRGRTARALSGQEGRADGHFKADGRLSAEERPVVGALANEVREAITADIARRTKELESAALAARLAAEEIDVTLPGKAPRRASATLSSRCWAS